jgi:hypothetical protein
VADEPATKADLANAVHEIKEYIDERTRDMQTELFEAFSAGQTIRLRKVEADQSNLDRSV